MVYNAIDPMYKKGDLIMMHIKENFFIEKHQTEYILKKRMNKKGEEMSCSHLGTYSTFREARDAAIKEMIREEVNKEKSAPLHEIIYMMKQKYQELSGENHFFCKISWRV